MPDEARHEIIYDGETQYEIAGMPGLCHVSNPGDEHKPSLELFTCCRRYREHVPNKRGIPPAVISSPGSQH